MLDIVFYKVCIVKYEMRRNLNSDASNLNFMARSFCEMPCNNFRVKRGVKNVPRFPPKKKHRIKNLTRCFHYNALCANVICAWIFLLCVCVSRLSS